MKENLIDFYDGMQLFNKYKTIVTEKLNYDYQFVLFDPEKGKIQDSFSIKNYKRK